MEVKLHPATKDDLVVVKNLVPYYVYDMSEYMGWPCKASGRFDGCDGIERYWSEKGMHAFMLRCGREWAGFAMVNSAHNAPDIDYSIGEFFVLRKFRGKGVGERIARQLFDKFRGRWRVEQLADNKPAVAFWQKVIDRYSGGKFVQRSGKCRSGRTNVLLFENGVQGVVARGRGGAGF